MAQTIKLVPNQPANVVTAGYPIIFNGNLFFECENNNNKQAQFGKFNGTDLSVLPNPTADKGAGTIGPYVIFNNLLTSNYIRNDETVALAVTNGSNVSLIPNSVTSGYFSLNVVNAGNLYYLQFVSDSSTFATGLEKYDGNKFTFIPPPADAWLNFVGGPFVFGNSVYVVYTSFQTGASRIAKVTANKLTPLNTSAFSNLDFGRDSILFKGKLWGTSSFAPFKKQLISFDGSAISAVANPDNGSVLGIYRVYKNKLCFQYRNAAGLIKVGTYDGNSMKFYSYGNKNLYDSNLATPSIIYNNELYFQNANTSGKYQLAKFNGTKVSLIDNPDTGKGVYGYYKSNIQPILCYGNLYVPYVNKAGRNQLAQYNGSKLTLIPNLNTKDTGYVQQAIVYKSKLYFVYLPVTMGKNPPTLAYLDISDKKIIDATENKTVVAQNNVLSIYPNPAKNTIHISYATSNAETLLQIFDINGQAVWQNTAVNIKGTNNLNINIAALAPGEYILQVKTNNGSLSKAFIKN